MSDLRILGMEGVVESINPLSYPRIDQIPTKLRVRVLRPGNASLRERKLWYDFVREGHFFFDDWKRVYLKNISCRDGSNLLGSA